MIMEVEAKQAKPLSSAERRYETWNTYNAFIARLNSSTYESSLTLEEEFLTYGKFVQTFRSYIHDLKPSSFTPEDKNFIRALVFENENQSTQLEFLAGAREELLNEVFYGNTYYLDDHTLWPKALELLSDLTDREYGQAVMNLGQEKEAGQALEALGGGKEITPEVQRLIGDKEDRSRRVQREAVSLMTQKGIFPRPVQEDLAGDTERLDRLVNVLITLSEESTFEPEDLDSRLKPFEELLKIEEDDSWIRQAALRASLGQHTAVKQIIKTLLDERSGIDREESEQTGREIRYTKYEFMWQLWQQKGLLPKELVQSFDDLIVLTQLADVSRKVINATPADKTAALLPFLEKGVSSVVIKEIVEGRLSFDEKYFSSQIEALLPFIEEETGKGVKHLGKKLIMAVMLTAVLSLANPETEKNSGLPDEVTSLLIKIPSDQLAYLKETDEQSKEPVEGGQNEPEDFPQEQEEVTPGRSGKTVTPGEKVPIQTEITPSTEDLQEPDDSLIQPRNDSAEQLTQELRGTDWNLEGNQLKGYYVTARSSFWDIRRRGWLINSDSVPYISHSANFSDLGLSKTVFLNSVKQELPVKPEYKLNVHPSMTYLTDIQSGAILQLFQDYNVVQRADGSNYLIFSPQWKGKTVEFKFSFIKNNILPTPSPSELRNMQSKIIDIKDLPSNVQNFALQMTGHKLSQGERAKLWEQFIQNNFLYSLNQDANRYYYAAKTNKEFFQRIFELRKTDCDVANTALTAVLRSQGIASRLVYGYANVGSPLNTNDRVLSGSERHGWVEAYIGGKWITLDATPVKMDDETRKQLKDKLTQQEMDRFGNQEKSGGANKEDASKEQENGSHSKEGDWFDNSLLMIPEILLLNYGLYKMANLIRKRNAGRVIKLKEAMTQKAETYAGDPTIAEALLKPGIENLSRYERSRLNRGTILVPALPGFMLLDSIKELILIRRHPLNEQINKEVAASSAPNALEFYTKVIGGMETEVLGDLYLAGYRQAKSHLGEISDSFISTFRTYRSWQGNMVWKWFYKKLENPVSKFRFDPDAETYFQKRERLKEQIYGSYASEFNKIISRDERKMVKKKKAYARPDPIPREDFDRLLDSLLDIKLAGKQLKDSYAEAQASLPKPLPGFRQKIKRMGRTVLKDVI